jgi:hypothetical protein
MAASPKNEIPGEDSILTRRKDAGKRTTKEMSRRRKRERETDHERHERHENREKTVVVGRLGREDAEKRTTKEKGDERTTTEISGPRKTRKTRK